MTSDGIFAEVLAYVSGAGPSLRAAAVGLVDRVRSDPATTIVRQTPDLFDRALDMYRRRPDKGYSLIDCMSMLVCRDLAITEVLTHDVHFEQEGFRRLL